MPDINRRDALKLLGLMAAAPTFSFACTGKEMSDAQQRAATSATTQPGTGYELQFFTDHEYETVRMLADMIIPADERSGSASEAGVPEFMDFIMTDELIPGRERRQTAMRGGLAWLDYECLERFDNPFIECTEQQRTSLLDEIAWPEQAPPEVSPGVEFFNSFRDLAASGFWSSKMGVEDLQYMGNTYVDEWTGCPDEVLDHIGVSEQA